MLTSLVMWTFIRQITGAPLPNSSSCTPSTIPLPLSTLVDAAGCAQSDQRSMWDIVWGCIVTIFSCTWIAIHPNIPGPHDSRWCVFKRGLTTMMCAIIAPELIMAWALRQHIGAWQFMHDYNENILQKSPQVSFYRRFTKYIKQFFCRKEECDGYNDVKWTKTHGFFIQMGGFMLYKDGVPVEVLTYQSLKERIKGKEVDIPVITERTINDKSKSDYLSKGFVVVQTTWFVVQCIARQAKSLPLAELEVFTLAFAVLNAITYAIWFDKPQNVQEGVRVDLKPASPNPLEPLSPESRLPEQSRSVHWSWLDHNLLNDYHQSRETWFGLLWFIAYCIPYHVVVLAVRFAVKLASKKCPNREEGTVMRVPMFNYEILANIPVVLEVYLPCIIGMLYGLLHVIAWNSGPTKFEKLLWSYSTLVITIVPLLYALIYVVERLWWHALFDDGWRSWVFFVIVALSTYVIACVSLIALALASLRQLPPATFCDVDWISFIPHF